MATWLATIEPGLPATQTLPLLQAQTAALYAIIEAQAHPMPHTAGDQQAVYPAILTAYTQVDDLARLLTAAWTAHWPDDFPKVVVTPEADLRTQIDQRLCLHAFLLARSSAAALAARNIEFEAVAGALDENTRLLTNLIATVDGDQAASAFLSLWRQQSGFFITYALALIEKDESRQLQVLDRVEQTAAALDHLFDSVNLPLAAANPVSGAADSVQSEITTYTATIIRATNAAALGDMDQFYTELHNAYEIVPFVTEPLVNALDTPLVDELNRSFAPLPTPTTAARWGWNFQQRNNALVSIPVVIRDGLLQPSRTEVPKGATVVWTNQATIAHTITAGLPNAETGLFTSSTIAPGRQFAVTFTQAGEYHYFSRVDPQLQGVIVVKAP
ncbi:MAG: cupredoxin domain-containing protein [Caldilineaceae bacterium]